MKFSTIKNTDIAISALGLGTVKFGRTQGVKYPHAFTLPTDKEIKNLLALSRSLKINLIDTAPAYGISETRLGPLLKSQRHDWVIATKAGEEFANGVSHFDFSAKHISQSVERSLRRLETDYLDIVLIHSDGRDQQIIEEDQVFQTLATLKQKGWIKAFGMSTKTVEGGLLALEYADIAMVTYNLEHTDEQAVIHYAEQQHKTVLIKKGLMSGHLKTDLQTAMNFIFKHQGVSSLIVGTLNPAHLMQNVQALQKALL